uniref:Exostosin1blike [Oryzias latipes] n=2 Tax=Lepeophtheirus salmonis TaxID=72036 RepID=A0A0K2T4E7_LEPSM
MADERLLLQVPEILRSIPQGRIFSMRKQTQILWNQYLKSVENIVTTTLEIINSRISRFRASRESHVWNSSPGGLVTLPSYSDVLNSFPFFESSLAIKKFTKFTAVIFVPNSFNLTHIYYNSSFLHSSPLYKLIKRVSASSYTSKIVILWMSANNASSSIPSISSMSSRRQIPIHHVPVKDVSNRFMPLDLIETEAVLSLDDDSLLTTEEIDFAFGVWKNFPDRIVGYPGRSHYWDHIKKSWVYTSKWLNEISMVLTGSAFYHRYYHTLYYKASPPGTKELVNKLKNCEDILMNFLVSSITKKSPIKVTQRKQFKYAKRDSSFTSKNECFNQRQECINHFASKFGYMPLKKSSVRFDPLLFKDHVSSSRKKYRRIDLIPISSGAL